MFFRAISTGVFTVAEMRWLQKGRWGSEDYVRDDNPECITELTHYGGIGGCFSSAYNVAWCNDSWDNCAQWQAMHVTSGSGLFTKLRLFRKLRRHFLAPHCTACMCQPPCGSVRNLCALHHDTIQIQSESSNKWLWCPNSLQCYRPDCNL